MTTPSSVVADDVLRCVDQNRQRTAVANDLTPQILARFDDWNQLQDRIYGRRSRARIQSELAGLAALAAVAVMAASYVTGQTVGELGAWAPLVLISPFVLIGVAASNFSSIEEWPARAEGSVYAAIERHGSELVVALADGLQDHRYVGDLIEAIDCADKMVDG